jgi:RND family efflux transporter MFP subunit
MTLLRLMTWSTCFMMGLAVTVGTTTIGWAQRPALLDDEIDCVIEPHRVIKLGSPDAGLLVKVPVDRGDFVTRGQVVAKLESGIEAATVKLARVRANDNVSLQSASARLDFQRREYARIKKLHAKKVVPNKVLQETYREYALAKLEVQKAKLELRLAKLELKRSLEVLRQRTLLSPIDGVVVERTLSPGEYIFEQAHVMTLAQVDPLNVEVFVPTSRFGTIEVGDRATVRPLLPKSPVRFASVKIVDHVFDAASDTFGVRLELPNPDRKLPSGIKCKVRFSKQ